MADDQVQMHLNTHAHMLTFLLLEITFSFLQIWKYSGSEKIRIVTLKLIAKL